MSNIIVHPAVLHRPEDVADMEAATGMTAVVDDDGRTVRLEAFTPSWVAWGGEGQ